MTIVKRTERGWPGHYLCAEMCAFRRNTLLEGGDGRSFVISSVGKYKDQCDGKMKEIGHQCYYETVVYEAKNFKPYIEANTTRRVDLASVDKTLESGLFAKSVKELQDKHSETGIDNKANEIHEHIVAIMTQLLERGGLIPIMRDC